MSSISTYTLDHAAHLTSNIRKATDSGGNWHTDSEVTNPATTRSCCQHTQRYSVNLSPINHSGSVTKRISQSHRHVSLSHCPLSILSSAGLNNHMLLSGGEDGPPDTETSSCARRGGQTSRAIYGLGKILPTHGRRLGLFRWMSHIHRALCLCTMLSSFRASLI